MRILLTGERGVGKSTVARRVFETLGLTPVGFQTLPLFENRRKTGYFLRDLATGREQLFAHRVFPDETRFGDFGVKTEVFAHFGVQILNELPPHAPWVLLDEIGVMEQKAPHFLQSLVNLWWSSRNQFWIVQKRSPFLPTLMAQNRPFLRFEVTIGNRNTLVGEIVAQMRRA